MDIDSIPLFSMLRSRLGYLSNREQLISQNVANADTPNFVPRDLKPFTIEAQDIGVDMGGPTQSGHIPLKPIGGAGVYRAAKAPDSETTLDGNQVVLEDQMVKMNEARTSYDAAIGFYEKSLGLLRMAARRPGT